MKKVIVNLGKIFENFYKRTHDNIFILLVEIYERIYDMTLITIDKMRRVREDD